MDEFTPEKLSASEPNNNEPQDQPRLAKFLCSFGGSVLPRPLDGRLRYVGGETRIVTVPRNISFLKLMQRMREIFDGTDLIKYQQPDEDLDALVSVVNDDDVINMMEEYDKLISTGEALSRLRIFLFSQNVLEDDALNSPSFDAFNERESERRYVDALNCLIDPKTGLNVADMEGSVHDNISLRHLNVPRPSAYGPKFSDVDSPYNGVGHYSPKVYNPQSHEMFSNLPFGGEDFHEKSGYPRNFTRGNHLNDANGTYCEHCTHTPYHQKSGYLEPQHRYSTGHGHNGFSHQRGDYYYHNNVDNSDYYNYYRSEANGNDRSWAPHNPLGYCYDDVRVTRAPEPCTPDGNRVNSLYPQGNAHDMHDSARFYNAQVATEAGNNEMFPNTTQQGENPSQQYNQAGMYNLESPYQVPQNVPPISSLRYKTQVHLLGGANPNPYESSNVVGVNPAFSRVIQDGTPSGGINPVSVGNPVGGINPVSRGAQDGISNGMNSILVKATQDGTSNEGINPIFVRDTPNATSNGGIVKPNFIIGTPEDSPRLSGAGPFERITNHWAGSSENCSPNISGLDSSASISDYGQLPGSRLNPNCSLITRPMVAETVVVRTIAESPVNECPVMKIPGNENLVVDNEIFGDPILDQSSSKKDNNMFVGITSVKAVEEPSALLELHEVAICVKEKNFEGGALEDGETLRLKEKTSDEESNLSGITPETGNIDHEVEKESTESDGVSGIESTTAELEAVNKGLQTIKNEDLEEVRELGQGTYGTVYHGKWRGSDVAVKRIKASCFSGKSSLRNKLIADFWKEAQTLSGLHHPNVVSFYGVVRDGPDGCLATVTEFMVNGSLKQYLHKKDRTIDRRKRIILAMDAAFGMEYLHSKNIVHFDLKCENLLVNMKDAQRPICKIGDLGLSKMKQQTMVSGGVRGTLPWMAPELLSEKNKMVSDKVDVYSFGICLWELLTGEEPYAEMHTSSILGGILNNTLRPQIPSWCDPEWKALMQSCWSNDPNERPSFSEISQKLRKMAPK